jgi:hypothetical protein
LRIEALFQNGFESEFDLSDMLRDLRSQMSFHMGSTLRDLNHIHNPTGPAARRIQELTSFEADLFSCAPLLSGWICTLWCRW